MKIYIYIYYGGLSEGKAMKTYLYGPTDFAKTLTLQFRVGDLDLPERRNMCVPVAGRRRKMLRCARVAKQ